MARLNAPLFFVSTSSRASEYKNFTALELVRWDISPMGIVQVVLRSRLWPPGDLRTFALSELSPVNEEAGDLMREMRAARKLAGIGDLDAEDGDVVAGIDWAALASQHKRR